MDRTPVLRYARASQAAYLSGSEQVAAVNAIGLTMIFSREDGLAFIAMDASTTVISFRGTDDLEDVVIDGRFLVGGNPLVHSGALARWTLLDDWFNRSLNDPRLPKKVILCGHSLGGMIATLAAFQWFLDVTAVYTYGSPRVGLGEFVAEYAMRNIATTRVVHDVDIVPTVPGLPYAHVCDPLRLNDKGQVIGIVRNWLRDILGFGDQAIADLDGHALADHHIDRYVAIATLYATPTLQEAS